MGSNILNVAKLDFSLLKVYIGTVLFIVIVPATVFTFVQTSLTAGISFAMCAAAMTSSYVFSVEEKNSMERLYGILPISKREMVLGRYAFNVGLGIGTLFISFIFQSIVLMIIGGSINGENFANALLTGTLLFTVSTAVQLPGYYKFGSIKGRFFIYLPIAGFFLFSIGFQKIIDNGVRVSVSPHILTGLAALLMIAAYIVSVKISVKIVEKKEI